MQRIVIFEGADMTGKTSIAREYSYLTRIPYFKHAADVKHLTSDGSYYVGMMRYCDPYFVDYLSQTDVSLIIDRHYPSEWVYSRVLGRTTDEALLRESDELFARMGAKVVICTRSSFAGVDDDVRPDILTSRRLEAVQAAYGEFARWTRCDTLFVTATGRDFRGDARMVDRWVSSTLDDPYDDGDIDLYEDECDGGL